MRGAASSSSRNDAASTRSRLRPSRRSAVVTRPRGVRQGVGERESAGELAAIAALPATAGGTGTGACPASSTPMAWMWPNGSTEIQTSSHAGGMTRSWMRSRSRLRRRIAVAVDVAEAAAGADASVAGGVAGPHPDQSWHASTGVSVIAEHGDQLRLALAGVAPDSEFFGTPAKLLRPSSPRSRPTCRPDDRPSRHPRLRWRSRCARPSPWSCPRRAAPRTDPRSFRLDPRPPGIVAVLSPGATSPTVRALRSGSQGLDSPDERSLGVSSRAERGRITADPRSSTPSPAPRARCQCRVVPTRHPDRATRPAYRRQKEKPP